MFVVHRTALYTGLYTGVIYFQHDFVRFISCWELSHMFIQFQLAVNLEVSFVVVHDTINCLRWQKINNLTRV